MSFWEHHRQRLHRLIQNQRLAERHRRRGSTFLLLVEKLNVLCPPWSLTKFKSNCRNYSAVVTRRGVGSLLPCRWCQPTRLPSQGGDVALLGGSWRGQGSQIPQPHSPPASHAGPLPRTAISGGSEHARAAPWVPWALSPVRRNKVLREYYQIPFSICLEELLW